MAQHRWRPCAPSAEPPSVLPDESMSTVWGVVGPDLHELTLNLWVQGAVVSIRSNTQRDGPRQQRHG